jgi:hypothetical protein
MAFAQQQVALQVSMIVNNQLLENLTLISNKLRSQAYFKQQVILFPQVQLSPLAPSSPPHSWMHYTEHASADVCQTWSIIAKFSLLLFIILKLVTSSYLVNYISI